jgi:hypothetical protein
VDHLALRRIRPVTVLLVVSILALGYSLVVRQRREARLRAALAVYKGRNQVALAGIMKTRVRFGWPDGTPLSEAIDELKQVTAGSFGFSKGLPIVVDADGLREAGRSLDSPVKAPPADDNPPDYLPLPFGQKLRLILEPLGLAAEVKDGVIVITSRGRAGDRADAVTEGDQERAP